MILAVDHANKLLRKEAHLHERPVVQLTSLMYNMNRNKKSKSLVEKDLYQFASIEDLELPDGKFGASMLRAINENLFPNWGLFVYKDLARSADSVAPQVYAAMCSDVVVLAPEYDGVYLSGLYLISESAGGTKRQLITNDNTIYTVEIPKAKVKYVAEQISLRVVHCRAI